MSSTSRRPGIPKKQQKLRAETSERLEKIVEAAELAAERVIDDAEAQAKSYLAQARAEADRLADGQSSGLADLIDTLLLQAVALRGEAEKLQTTLEEARVRLASAAPEDLSRRPAQPDREPDPPQPPPRLRAVGGDDDPAATASSRSGAAGARLLATQMAVSGSTREEIEQCLRNRFEIEDTKPVLDAILGPED